jgi:hypothetical protein
MKVSIRDTAEERTKTCLNGHAVKLNNKIGGAGSATKATTQRVAVFYTKLHQRLLRPPLAAGAPPAPTDLRHALATIDRHVRGYITDAHLGPPG